MQKDDVHILEAVNKKNSKLYKYVYTTYYASLCRYAKRFVGDICDEEDLVQEIFVKLWEKEIFFTNLKALSTYLYRSVYNACLIYIRDHKAERSSELLDVQVYESEDNERYLIEEEYFRQIYIAINNLGTQRKTIILMSLAGKSNEEIATELNISINTVKTLKRRAYNDLRNILPLPAFFLLLNSSGYLFPNLLH
ncbi:MAG: sigma-70 family RNA polymerase sigma factor [Odoribacter sp.]